MINTLHGPQGGLAELFLFVIFAVCIPLALYFLLSFANRGTRIKK